MPQDNTSWIKGAKAAPSKEEHRLIVSHPQEVQSFLDSTHENKGASMFLHNMKMVNYGDKMNIVGKEPSRITKQPVKTSYVDVDSPSPKLSAQQFASHFLDMKKHAQTTRGTTAKSALIGSWIDTRSPEKTRKGVQMDFSSGYSSRRTAEKKMVDREEDAIVDASKGFQEIFNEDVRHKYTNTPRPKKED